MRPTGAAPFLIPDHDRTLITALHERGYVVLTPEHLDRLAWLLQASAAAPDDRAARLESARVHGMLQAIVAAAAVDMAVLAEQASPDGPPTPYAGRDAWAEPSGWGDYNVGQVSERERVLTERAQDEPG